MTVPGDRDEGGARWTLSRTVSPAPTGGTVQFMDGGTAIGAPVDVVAGKATLSYAFSSVGEHQINAVYSGAPGHVGSTAAVGTVTVSETGTGGDTGSAGGSLGNLFGSSYPARHDLTHVGVAPAEISAGATPVFVVSGFGFVCRWFLGAPPGADISFCLRMKYGPEIIR